MQQLHPNQHAFTLIEVLLVVAIISILAAVSVPLYYSMETRNELNVATSTLVQDLYQAQSYTRAGTHSCVWGVAIRGQNITLYCGNSYNSRNNAYDDTFVASPTITFSGLDETTFSKPYGLARTTGTFNLNQNGKTTSVNINFVGTLEY